MGNIFLKFLNLSITAGWLILAIMLFRFVFRKTPKWVNCLLWGMVAIRLICPAFAESSFSVLPSTALVKTTSVASGEMQNYIPSIDSDLPIVENVINPALNESFAYSDEDSAAPIQIVTYVAGIIWLCGMALLLLYALISRLRIHLMVREAVSYKDHIYECDGVSSPFILGIVKPKIYLPSGVEEKEREYIIAHESAHLKRKDHWWKPFGFLLLAIYWFQPLCWLAYILLCRDIELACDEKVIKDMDFDEKKEYSKVLLACGQQRKMIMACPLAFGEVGVKERVKTVLNYKKPAFWIVLVAIAACLIIGVCFLTNPPEEYRIRVTIPAGSTETFCYSDEEISPKKNTVTLYMGEGVGDVLVVLLPVEVKEENAYEPTYITPGMPAKMEVEKGAWFRIGVYMQNPTEEDIHVYVSVKNVEVRISDAAGKEPLNDTTLSQGGVLKVESAFLDDEEPQRYNIGDLDGNGEPEYVLISHENELPGYDGHLSVYVNGESIYEYDDILRMGLGSAIYIDLDDDKKQEIFLRFYPFVNSAPLMEYIVLKQTGDTWTALEMPHGENMLDNAFPISVSCGSEKNTIVIGCEGTDKQIVYDITAHYQALIDTYEESGMDAQLPRNVLNGTDRGDNPYAEGDAFGGVAAWGIWNIERGFWKDKNCLIATHGIQGPCGNTDILGELDVYFNYNKDGKVNILNIDFRSTDAEVLEEMKEPDGEETTVRKGNEIGMEGIDASAENMGKVYTVNEDGTYTCEGKNYDYKIAVTGRDATAVCDSRYIVLTDDKDITYEDIWWSMFGSGMDGVFSYTVLIGVEALPEE